MATPNSSFARKASSDRVSTCGLRPPFRGAGTSMGARPHTTGRPPTGGPPTTLWSSRARREEFPMASDRHVLVVGGTGMLGGQVVTELLSRGKRVRALVRPTSDAKSLERTGTEILRGDMMDLPSLLRAMETQTRWSARRPDIPGTARVIPTRLTRPATATSLIPRAGP